MAMKEVEVKEEREREREEIVGLVAFNLNNGVL